ncbi:hypothetical protein DFH28DRAFT_972094 [Melampsora americana]|nr:hypothetical protein DFH28DRAFT_972094 [Melampsora americana]
MNYFLPQNSYHHHHQKKPKKPSAFPSKSESQESQESNLNHEESNIEDWTTIEIKNQKLTSSNLETNQSEPHSDSNLISNIRLDSPITNLDQSQLISKLLPNVTFDENQIDSSIHFDPQAWKRGEEVKRSSESSSAHQHQSEKLIRNLIPISNKIIRSDPVISNELRSSSISHRIPSTSSLIATSSHSNLNKILNHIPRSYSNQQTHTNLPRWRPYLSLSRIQTKNSKIDSGQKPIEILPEEVEDDHNQPSSTHEHHSNKSDSNKAIDIDDDDGVPPKDWWFKITINTWNFIGISSLVIAFGIGIGIGTKKYINLNKLKSIIFKSFKHLSHFILY